MAKKPKKAPKSKTKSAKNKSSKAKAKKTSVKAKTRVQSKSKKASSHRTETVLPKDLEARLMALAIHMDKSMDAVLIQALCEFADAWEDHFRTVDVMVEEDERVQIVVKPE